MAEKDSEPKDSAKDAKAGQDAAPKTDVKTPPMPDASGDELRQEIRSLRDENKSRRLTQKELEDKFKDLDVRFVQLNEDSKTIQGDLRLSQFRALALEAGVDAELIQFLDSGSFDLSDREATLDALRKLPSSKQLPSAGKTVSPKKGKKLTIADIEKMSDKEFEERKEEIVALQRDANYR